ncbi:hypothetical protein RKD19_000289 [Streptomyces canus]
MSRTPRLPGVLDGGTGEIRRGDHEPDVGGVHGPEGPSEALQLRGRDATVGVVLALHDNPPCPDGSCGHVGAQVPWGTGDLDRCEAVAFEELCNPLLQLPTGLDRSSPVRVRPSLSLCLDGPPGPPQPSLLRLSFLAIACGEKRPIVVLSQCAYLVALQLLLGGGQFCGGPVFVCPLLQGLPQLSPRLFPLARVSLAVLVVGELLKGDRRMRRSRVGVPQQGLVPCPHGR